MAYYAAIAETVRKYLTERFEFPAFALTTRELQERTLEAEQQRFDVGSSTALLVAQAQRDLLESRIAEVEAVVNYRIALVRLHLAEGSLLERHGVLLPLEYGAAPK